MATALLEEGAGDLEPCLPLSKAEASTIWKGLSVGAVGLLKAEGTERLRGGGSLGWREAIPIALNLRAMGFKAATAGGSSS